MMLYREQLVLKSIEALDDKIKQLLSLTPIDVNDINASNTLDYKQKLSKLGYELRVEYEKFNKKYMLYKNGNILAWFTVSQEVNNRTGSIKISPIQIL